MLKRARPIFHPKALARLAAIAQTEPERLAQFGLDASVVARETQRAARREALARVTPRDKRLSDAEAWRAWLHAYRLRLWRERRAVAGADDEDAPATAAALEAAAARRRAVMGASNPRFVLRQHIAARVIERAEAGDYVELRRAPAPAPPRPRLPARPVLSDLGGPLDWSRLPAGGCSASWQSRTTTRATPSSSGTPRCRPTGRTISSSPDRVRPAPLARPAGREGAWVGGGSRALYSRGATDEGHARKASLLRARAASGEDRSARNASSSARPPSP